MSVHEQFADDLALYALGCLEGDERAALEKHLEECASCRRELEQLRGDAALLALSASGPRPPARSQARLMEAVDEKALVLALGPAGTGKTYIAISKAVEDAKKAMFKVPKHHNTVPHEILGVFGAGRVLLKPASPGTGVIAGAGVRAVLELAGIRDILAKSLGTSNPINLVRATEAGLRSLRTRLGLSAKQLSLLLGVSEQSVYNWEAKKTTPRKEQFAAIIGMRDLGKREAQERLDAFKSPKREKRMRKTK